MVYLSGALARPGVYALPDQGLTLRRALSAAGLSGGSFREVVVSRTRDGRASVAYRIAKADLDDEEGIDPALEPDDQVSVK